MCKSFLILRLIKILAFTATFSFQNSVLAKTSAEVQKIATGVTVKLEYYNTNGQRDNGSGLIYQRQGDEYTIITNAHVICGTAEGNDCPINTTSYAITTPDYSRHQMIYGSAKRISSSLDLAVIKFRSSKSYSLAQIADSSKANNQETIYTAGFPTDQLKLRFSKGKLIANVKKRMSDDNGGYTMLYDAFTLPGMSGSGVFNSQGQVLAIHGNGDRFYAGTDINNDYTIGEKIGINRGIPINRLSNTLSTAILDNQQGKITADELVILGYNKSIRIDSKVKTKSQKKESIKLIDQAIKLQPHYLHAHLLRAWIYMQLGDSRSALLDYNKAIDIDPNYDVSYSGRASAKFELGDHKGSLKDYDRAISINAENFNTLEGRGIIRQILDDNKGALDDFNRASKINNGGGDRIIVLIGKCGADGAVGNTKEALQNCNKAIEVYKSRGGDLSRMSGAYSNLGAVKLQLGDKQGALVDLNKSISLNSNFPNHYINRASVKYALNDKLGALADFNRALSLNSTSINIYLGIGLIKEESGEFQEAIDHYRKAEEIYRQKGDILNRAGIFYTIANLEKKINPNQEEANSSNPSGQPATPSRGWLEDTINQGLLDLIGQPRK
jgi:tetratricopeptide (TPR) repeat protein